MSDLRKQIEAAKQKAVRELEKGGKDAYLPANRWGFDLSAIDRTNLSPSAKKGYRREIRALLNTGIAPLDIEALQEYAVELTPKRRSVLKSALRLMAGEHEQADKGSVTLENLASVQAFIQSIEAMQRTGKAKQHKEKTAYIKLTPAQVKQITSLCGDDLAGKRDWIVLGLLLGAGLLREEVTTLTFEALKQETGGKVRDVLQVTGRGAKDRVVPISRLLAERLREWEKIVGGGFVARSVGKGGKLGKSLSTWYVQQIVRKYGKMIDIPRLNALDLRRTYAQFTYNAGVPVTRIQELLGQVKLVSTKSYLDLETDRDDITDGLKDYLEIDLLYFPLQDQPAAPGQERDPDEQ